MTAMMMDLVIKRIIKETDDVIRLILAKEDGEVLPTYQAGAHIVVQVPSGIRRQYSLCFLPTTGKEYEIAVLKEPNSRGGSEQIHAAQEGDVVKVFKPQNHFLLNNPRSPALLMAAGIGVTPLMAMAQMLYKSGTDFSFHYSAKSAAKAPYYESLSESPYAGKVMFHFSEEDHGRADIESILSQETDKRDIYVCGPLAYIDEVMDTALKLGWAKERLHREYFTGPMSQTPSDAPRESFQVKVGSTGQIVDVEAEQTITQALKENGVDIPISCEEGWCGTCLVTVLEGEPEHLDLFLSEAEQRNGNQIIPCRSRSRSDCLVLDI